MPRKKKRTHETESGVFPTILKKLMDEKKLKQGDVAEGIGMTRQAISLYTTGQSTPDINTLSKMAYYFGVSCDYLVGRTNITSFDVDVQQTCASTGLSETSVGILLGQQASENDFDKRAIAFINAIVSYPFLDDFADAYYKYGEVRKNPDFSTFSEQHDKESYMLFKLAEHFNSFAKTSTDNEQLQNLDAVRMSYL
jgi:transcriptional regulator with XRE-family HTH domain